MGFSLPVDFISTHIYPTDPLGFEGADTEEQLANSPRGLMRESAQRVRGQSRDRPVYFTEWNMSSNPRDAYHDEPEYLSRSQVEQLEAASRLVKEPLGIAYESRTIHFDVDLPPHAVAAVTVELAPEPSDTVTPQSGENIVAT